MDTDKNNWEEKDLVIMEKIKESSEDIEIPESLSPENMMKRLEEPERKRRKNMGNIAKILAAAACIGIVSFTAWQSDIGNDMHNKTGSVKNQGTVENDYSDIYNKLKKVKDTNKSIYYKSDATLDMAENIEGDGVGVAEDVKSDEAGSDVSDTNVQVEGIDEADMVKSDGKYIYALDVSKQKVDIISMENEKKVSEIQVIKSYLTFDNADMYVSDNILVVMGTYIDNETEINIFDISDKENPVEINSICQQGNYNTSRLSGGYLYVMSNSYIKGELTEDNCVPRLDDKQIEASGVVVTDDVSALEYEFVITIDLNNPGEVLDKKAVTMDSSNSCIYMSADNIFVTNYNYGADKTGITKIGYKDGKFTDVIEGSIDGRLYGQFAMDEYNGHLRLVSTKGKNGETNIVYVLDESLEVKGKIDGIADGESIYSARFMGDIGYFVTFYQTDPLFKVDFSDPSNPVILGQLEITGFSDYLHPWGDDKILGIGYVDSRLKLSMFELGNNGDMDEVTRKVFNDCDFSTATVNHKAIMIDDEENLIGFLKSTCGASDAFYEDYFNEKYIYEVYSYKDGEFECMLSEELLSYESMQEDMDGGNYGKYENVYNTRGIFTGEKLYIVVPGEEVRVYDRGTMELKNTIEISRE